MVCDHGVSKHLSCGECVTPTKKSSCSSQENDSDVSQGEQVDIYQALDLAGTHDHDIEYHHDHCPGTPEVSHVDSDVRESLCRRCGRVVSSSLSDCTTWIETDEEDEYDGPR